MVISVIVDGAGLDVLCQQAAIHYLLTQEPQSMSNMTES